MKQRILAELDQRVSFELGRLLKDAIPTQLRIHQLAKLITQEKPDAQFENVRHQVIEYFKVRFEHRSAGQFLKTFGVKPYPWLHAQFILNFSNALISETRLFQVAGKFRHYLRTSLPTPNELVETDFLHLTLYKLVKPKGYQRKAGFALYEFVLIWKKTAAQKFGDKFNPFFEGLIDDLQLGYGSPLSNPPIGRAELKTNETGNDLELTQTDIDWMKSVIKAIDNNFKIPDYPLSRGPNKPSTRQLQRLVRARNRLTAGPYTKLLSLAARNLSLTYLKLYQQPAA